VNGLIFDHTVLAAMGTHQQVSDLIVEIDGSDRGEWVAVPAMCLAAAEAEKAGLTRHVGYLPALRIMPLDGRETDKVGALIGLGTDWRNAHAIAVARETGAPVVTLEPDGYGSYDVETITLQKN
jgi:hypothetical protein